jgi:hypothetical protein
MTSQEHALMISVLALQMEAIHALTDALKSRGILEADDLHAFWSIRPLEAKRETMEKAHQVYWILAKKLGIDDEGLETPPSQ